MDKKELIPPGLNYLADNIRTKGNILGASKAEGARWAKGLDLKKEKATLFFAGCGYQYGNKLESMMSLIRKMDKSVVGSDLVMGLAGFQKKLGVDAAGTLLKFMGKGGEDEAQPLKDAVKILRKIGIDPGYLAEEEPCCGGILHYMGLKKEFAGHARKVKDSLESGATREIIGIVPSCTYTMRKLILDADQGSDLKVRHFSEVLAENLSSLKLRFPRRAKITYHDPCQLVRYMGLVDEPRRILSSIQNLEFVETKWTHGDFATCCGGGGGFEAVFPELSEILAVNRVKELLETGADIIATQCPGCIMQLETGLKVLKVQGVEVLDLAQLVAMSLED
jgi:Fe-S oxidoreductase